MLGCYVVNGVVDPRDEIVGVCASTHAIARLKCPVSLSLVVGERYSREVFENL